MKSNLPVTHSPSKDSFLLEVAEHRMVVKRDDGLYRHLTFSKPNTNNLHFHLTTWPGYLAITGDCGSYVFSRLPDMFEFHREEGPYEIDFRYWKEKLQAADAHGELESYDQALILDALREEVRRYEFETWAEMRLCWGHLKGDILDDPYSSPREMVEAILDFSSDHPDLDGPRLSDFYEYGLKSYNHRFIWACRAIAWGISQYDSWKVRQPADPQKQPNLVSA